MLRNAWRGYVGCVLVLCLACDGEEGGPALLDSRIEVDSGGVVEDGPAPGVDAGADLAVDAGPAIPACSSTVAQLLQDVLAQAPAKLSDAYQQLAPGAAAELRAGLKALLAGDLQTAAARASAASYAVCQAGDVVFWRSAAGDGQAALAVRTGAAARPVAIGVPHALFELKTPEEGLEVFTKLQARALVVAGAHRCASTSPSSCSGTTQVCGATSAPYRRSDAGHNVDTAFQLFHEVLLDSEPSLVALSLHGKSGDGISISNGTTAAVTPGSPVAKLAPLLAQAFPGAAVTSCNPQAGVPHQLLLCGTTNVQGRLANGASTPCTQAAAGASGRFLHLEQSLAVRLQPALVADALDKAL